MARGTARRGGEPARALRGRGGLHAHVAPRKAPPGRLVGCHTKHPARMQSARMRRSGHTCTLRPRASGLWQTCRMQAGRPPGQSLPQARPTPSLHPLPPTHHLYHSLVPAGPHCVRRALQPRGTAGRPSTTLGPRILLALLLVEVVPELLEPLVRHVPVPVAALGGAGGGLWLGATICAMSRSSWQAIEMVGPTTLNGQALPLPHCAPWPRFEIEPPPLRLRLPLCPPSDPAPPHTQPHDRLLRTHELAPSVQPARSLAPTPRARARGRT